MPKTETQFSALQHGYEFANRFEIRLPVKFPRSLGGLINLKDVVYGLCGGMCFSALDYFYAGLPRPDFTSVEVLDREMFLYLLDRQMDSLTIPTLLKLVEWMMMEDARMGTRMARSELPRLRKMLDQGNPCVLALIRVRGFGDPTHNHQVVATAYEFDPATKTTTVTLYDPNHPHETPTIRFTPGKAGNAPQLSQSTGEGLRGFFIIPYRFEDHFPRPAVEELPEELASDLPPAREEAFRLYADEPFDLRKEPRTDAPSTGSVGDDEALRIAERDPISAFRKIGDGGEWIFVQTRDGEEGWAPAEHLRTALRGL